MTFSISLLVIASLLRPVKGCGVRGAAKAYTTPLYYCLHYSILAVLIVPKNIKVIRLRLP